MSQWSVKKSIAPFCCFSKRRINNSFQGLEQCFWTSLIRGTPYIKYKFSRSRNQNPVSGFFCNWGICPKNLKSLFGQVRNRRYLLKCLSTTWYRNFDSKFKELQRWRGPHVARVLRTLCFCQRYLQRRIFKRSRITLHYMEA